MDVITTHMNADFDCLGGMTAAKKLYPDALLVFPGSQEKSVRDFLARSGLAHVLSFTRIREIDLARVERLVMVDCQHSSRIGRFAEILGRPGLTVDIYDHHSNGDVVPSGGVIRECGACSSILTHILMERGMEVTPEEATIIMLGIYEDTGNLTFPSTTPDDYAAAAWLLRRGASLKTVSEFVTQEMTAQQVSLLNDLLTSVKTITIHGVDISFAHASTDYYVGDIAALAHMIRDMENIGCLFIAVDMGRRIYVVARNRLPEVDAGELLRVFGGGGHPGAASATVRDMTLIETLRRLEELLRERINPPRVARDIMSSPVKTLPAEATLQQARELLIRYNVSAMPVAENGSMTGIISRRTVEKALYHGLGSVPVSEYMNTDFFRASPDTPISEVQDYIIGHNRRFVPVFDHDRLAGAITRTDLLRYMYAGARSRGEQAYDLGAEDLKTRTRDFNHVILRVLSPRVVRVLKDLGKVGDELDVPVYGVGGFIRDLILGVENRDIDITVEGDGILFAETFAARYGCRVKSHKKFDTAVIVFPDGFKIDVASTRLEYYETPGALPTVERSSLKMDLYRRDFTINTLAVRINRMQFGTLVDYFGGQRDIRDRVIRVLHNLSFVEDPTRVFRAIRFELKLGFHISPHTENLIRNAVKMNFLEALGGKRLLTELVYIFRDNDPVAAGERMNSFGLFRFIHPGIRFDAETRALLTECRRVIDWFQLLFLDRPFERWVVLILSITHSLSGDEFVDLCRRLAVAEHYREKLAENRREGHAALATMEGWDRRRREPRNSDIYFLIRGISTEVLLYLMGRTSGSAVKKMISLYFTHLQEVKISIGGEDLKALEVPPGPLYRCILDTVLAARLDGTVASREEEMALARREIARPCRPRREG